jgi:hypothetical protein
MLYLLVLKIPLHDDLIAELSRVINDLLSRVVAVDDLSRYVREVYSYPLRTSQSSEAPDVVASDSSRVVKKLSLATVYAIQAVSANVSLRESRSSRFVIKCTSGYYIPTPSEVVPEELMLRITQLLSRVLEVDSVLEVVDRAEVALFDGSLISFLWGYSSRPLPKGLRFTGYSGFSNLRDMWYEIFRKITEIVKLVKPLFIAKTLRRSYYVDILLSGETPKEIKSEVNDLVLINMLRRLGKLPKQPYILQPVYVTTDKLPKPLNSLNIDLSPLIPMTVTYVAFNHSTQPYQVSVPGVWGVDELVDIISSIYIYSHTGYPDPLRVVHSKSKLSTEEFKYILYKLGLNSIPTGRELLGEFL